MPTVSLKQSKHCVKSVQIRSYFWSVIEHFSRSEDNFPYIVRVRKFDALFSHGKENLRSSPQELLLEKDVLKIYSKFTGEYSCRSVISIKLFCNYIETHFGMGVLV